MAIYNFHIFDSAGNCIFSLQPNDKSQEILYGFLYSLKSFIQRISPTLQMDNNFFYYQTSIYNLVFYEFVTNLKFVLIITNNPNTNQSNKQQYDSQFYRELMIQIHKRIYVEYHIKNAIIRPHSVHNKSNDDNTMGNNNNNNNNNSKCNQSPVMMMMSKRIDSQLFRQQLDQFLRQNLKI